jgi:hypothetical protein
LRSPIKHDVTFLIAFSGVCIQPQVQNKKEAKLIRSDENIDAGPMKNP